MKEPVSIGVALGGVLTTGVALLAVFAPDLSTGAQAAIIAFGNSVILLGTIVWTRMQVTPIAAPELPEDTKVTVITPEGVPNRTVTL